MNLFHVCVHVLLRDYPAIYNGQQTRLVDLWRQLAALLALKQLRAREITAINALCASFNQGLREALDQLRPKVDELLADLGWDDVKLTALTTPGLAYNNAPRPERHAPSPETWSHRRSASDPSPFPHRRPS